MSTNTNECKDKKPTGGIFTLITAYGPADKYCYPLYSDKAAAAIKKIYDSGRHFYFDQELYKQDEQKNKQDEQKNKQDEQNDWIVIDIE
jgi:hypothetical protein